MQTWRFLRLGLVDGTTDKRASSSGNEGEVDRPPSSIHRHPSIGVGFTHHRAPFTGDSPELPVAGRQRPFHRLSPAWPFLIRGSVDQPCDLLPSQEVVLLEPTLFDHELNLKLLPFLLAPAPDYEWYDVLLLA